MSESQDKKVDIEALRAAARDVVAAGKDIQQEVHKLTLTALREGGLEKERVKQIVQSVLEGAREGAERHGEHLKSALSEAVSGLDTALVKTASATKLAIEEAAGHLREFTDHDIKRALNDLEGLESTLIDVVSDVAKGSSDLAGRILQDLASHARHSGTAVGRQVQESLSHLSEQWRTTGRDSVIAGADAAKSVSVKIARAASGFLAGLADTLESLGKQDRGGKNTGAKPEE